MVTVAYWWLLLIGDCCLIVMSFIAKRPFTLGAKISTDITPLG